MSHQFKPAWLTRTGAADVVVLACAASAGIHAGLVPEHLREEPRLGVAFALTVMLLLAMCAAIALRPLDRRVARAAAVALGGLIVAYLATRTTGIPLLDPQPETVDAIGLAAVGIELGGLAGAVWLAQPIGRQRRRPALQEVTR
jgi:putative copper export protein